MDRPRRSIGPARNGILVPLMDDNMSRVPHRCRTGGRTEGDQQDQGQERTHRICSNEPTARRTAPGSSQSGPFLRTAGENANCPPVDMYGSQSAGTIKMNFRSYPRHRRWLAPRDVMRRLSAHGVRRLPLGVPPISCPDSKKPSPGSGGTVTAPHLQHCVQKGRGRWSTQSAKQMLTAPLFAFDAARSDGPWWIGAVARHRSRCARTAAANVLPSFTHVSSGRSLSRFTSTILVPTNP